MDLLRNYCPLAVQYPQDQIFQIRLGSLKAITWAPIKKTLQCLWKLTTALVGFHSRVYFLNNWHLQYAFTYLFPIFGMNCAQKIKWAWEENWGGRGAYFTNAILLPFQTISFRSSTTLFQPYMYRRSVWFQKVKWFLCKILWGKLS